MPTFFCHQHTFHCLLAQLEDRHVPVTFPAKFADQTWKFFDVPNKFTGGTSKFHCFPNKFFRRTWKFPDVPAKFADGTPKFRGVPN